ncbi:hypothetical protein WA158_001989 [Blastocystis sp. Blastoise]
MINEDAESIEAPTIKVSGPQPTFSEKCMKKFRIYKEKGVYYKNLLLDKFHNQTKATQQAIIASGALLVVLVFIVLFSGAPRTNIELQDKIAEPNACPYVDLSPKIDGSIIYGRVNINQMLLYVHPLDDPNNKPTPQFIYTHGGYHDKFVKGDWWKYDSTNTPHFTGALSFVGVFGSCLTDVSVINLPLSEECNLKLDNDLVATPTGIQFEIQAQAVRKVEYYIYVPKDTKEGTHATAEEVFVKENMVGITTTGEMFKKILPNLDFSQSFNIYIGAIELGCRSDIYILDSKSYSTKAGDATASLLSIQQTATTTTATSADSIGDDNTMASIATLLLVPKEDVDKADREIYKNRVKNLLQVTKHIRPVDYNENPGGYKAKESEGGCDPWLTNIKVRSIDIFPTMLVIKFMVIGGPVDVYYMVKPENDKIGDPSIQALATYGEKAGNFVDEKVEVVITQFVPSVRSYIYIGAIQGKCEYGVFKRRFIA